MNLKLIALLPLSVVLAIGSACVWDDPPVVATVNLARTEGNLSEVDGCLRINGSPGSIGDAIVWQKDVLTVERRGDTVDIYAGIYAGNVSDGESPIASLRLGDSLIGGGRGIGPEMADEHAGAGFSERCPGPYWLLGMVSVGR